jgi:hypothetical protein
MLRGLETMGPPGEKLTVSGSCDPFDAATGDPGCGFSGVEAWPLFVNHSSSGSSGNIVSKESSPKTGLVESAIGPESGAHCHRVTERSLLDHTRRRQIRGDHDLERPHRGTADRAHVE